MKKRYIIIFALLVVLLATVMTGCGSSKIDLKDYIEVTFSGAEGYGKAKVTLDEEELLRAIYGKSKNSDDLGGTFATMLLLEDIEVELDTKEGLKNGDKVTVTVTYPDNLQEALGVKLSPKNEGSWTETVADLKKLLEMNPFDSYEVSFSGYNGMGQATVTDNSGYGLACTFSQEKALSNGDKVTLTLAPKNGGDLVEYCAEYKGFVPTETYREYTVSGLTEIGEIDLFEDIDITVTGYSPFLSVTISSRFTEHEIRYKLVDAENGKLTKGDTITIQAYAVDDYGMLGESGAELNQKCLDAFGAYPVSDTMTYTIDPDTQYYIMDPGEMSEDALAWLVSEAKDIFDSASKNRVTIQSVNYYGYYLKTVKPHRDKDTRNMVYIVHEVTYVYGGKTYTHYNVVRFTDVVMQDGACHYFKYGNLYSWTWGDAGVSDLFYFESNHISSTAVDYNCVTVLANKEADK